MMARHTAVHQKDGNAEALYAEAERLGMTVERMQQPVDALVGHLGLTVAVEVKQPGAKLRRGQVQFFQRFTGAAATWRTVGDVRVTYRTLCEQAARLRKAEEWEP